MAHENYEKVHMGLILWGNWWCKYIWFFMRTWWAHTWARLLRELAMFSLHNVCVSHRFLMCVLYKATSCVGQFFLQASLIRLIVVTHGKTLPHAWIQMCEFYVKATQQKFGLHFSPLISPHHIHMCCFYILPFVSTEKKKRRPFSPWRRILRIPIFDEY